MDGRIRKGRRLNGKIRGRRWNERMRREYSRLDGRIGRRLDGRMRRGKRFEGRMRRGRRLDGRMRRG